MLDDYFLWNQAKTSNAEVAEYVTAALDMSAMSVCPKGGFVLAPQTPLTTPPDGVRLCSLSVSNEISWEFSKTHIPNMACF